MIGHGEDTSPRGLPSQPRKPSISMRKHQAKSLSSPPQNCQSSNTRNVCKRSQPRRASGDMPAKHHVSWVGSWSRRTSGDTQGNLNPMWHAGGTNLWACPSAGRGDGRDVGWGGYRRPLDYLKLFQMKHLLKFKKRWKRRGGGGRGKSREGRGGGGG